MRGYRYLLLVFFSTCVAAGSLYRYKDEQGNTVLNNTIPPEFVSGGYQILNEQGQILKDVPPAPTVEELARMKEESEARSRRQTEDANLMKLYRGPDDVDRARESWNGRLNVELNLKKNQRAVYRSRLNELHAKAAEFERVGRTVPAGLQEQIGETETLIQQADDDINRINERKAQDQLRFDQDKQRVQEILAGQEPGGAEPEADSDSTPDDTIQNGM